MQLIHAKVNVLLITKSKIWYLIVKEKKKEIVVDIVLHLVIWD